MKNCTQRIGRKRSDCVSKEKKKTTFVDLVVYYGAIIFVAAIIIFVVLYKPPIESRIVNVNTEQALSLVYSHESLTIIDGRDLLFYNYSRIPGSIWIDNINTFISETKDILLYADGNDILNIAKTLLKNNDGNVYYIEGGFEAWKEKGYPIEL